MIDISKIREGDEVIIRGVVDYVLPEIDDGRIGVRFGEYGPAVSLDAKQIKKYVPVFRPDDLVIIDDRTSDWPAVKVLMCDGDYVVFRDPDIQAPQVIEAARLSRVTPPVDVPEAAE